MKNGTYYTKAGSRLEISGKHSGIATLDFDWFEEGGCIDCKPNPYPEGDGGDWYITWACDYCGGGRARLEDQKHE